MTAQIIAGVLLAVCTGWTVAALLAVVRIARARPRTKVQSGEAPPVTVLKPLSGADPGLRQNLVTFFNQDYPAYELVFGVEDPDDPAILVVESLQRQFPHVRTRLVVHSGADAINPKVRNLLGMLPHASHDLSVISDSNVRAPRGYVSELVATWLADPRIGLVTNVFTGTGERNLGAALEAVQLNGFCAAGAALPTALGDSCVVGKSMLFSRRALERLGGLTRVSHVLAEDFVMGKLFQHAGYSVVLARTVLENHLGVLSLSAFCRRHLRWSMLRWRMRPAAAALEVVTSPLSLLPIAVWGLGLPGVVWVIALMLVRDVGGWVCLRGWQRAWLPLLLAPVRELCMLGVWAAAPFKRHVTWRGNRVRLGAGTLLFRREVYAGRG